MSGILSNAISGLQASQNALRTAGHNISNANTQGYSRQEVNYVTRPEQIAGGAGYIGSGVTTASIERVVNEFVTTQLRSDTSTYNQLNKYSLNISKVDKLFAEAALVCLVHYRVFLLHYRTALMTRHLRRRGS